MKLLKFLLPMLLLFSVSMNFVQMDKMSSSESDSEELVAALQDTIQTYKDQSGKEVTKIKTVEVEKKVFIELNTGRDSLLQKIQSLTVEVKKLTDASVVVTKTEFQKTIPIHSVIEKVDSSEVPIEREFASAIFKDPWINVKVKMDLKADSMDLNLSTENVLSIWHQDVRKGWFKPSFSEVFVRNDNPYTRTKDLRSYKVKHKERKIGLGLIGGVGFNQNLKFEPFIGGGFFYRLI